MEVVTRVLSHLGVFETMRLSLYMIRNTKQFLKEDDHTHTVNHDQKIYKTQIESVDTRMRFLRSVAGVKVWLK